MAFTGPVPGSHRKITVKKVRGTALMRGQDLPARPSGPLWASVNQSALAGDRRKVMPEQPRSQAKPLPFSKVRRVNSRVCACSTILQTANCVRCKGGELRVGGTVGRGEAPAGGGARVDRVLIPGP